MKAARAWATMGALAGCVPLAPAISAQWSAQPILGSRVDYHSNRQLTEDSESSEGGWLTLEAIAKRATEESEWTLRPQLTLQRFASESQLDSNDGSITLSGYQLGELSRFDVSMFAARASTLTTELEETGIVAARARRESRIADFSWRRSITPDKQLTLQLDYSHVDYPGGERFGLVGYRYPSGALGFEMRLSPFTSLSATAFGGRLTSLGSATRSENGGLRLGVQHVFSAQTQLGAMVGLSETRIDTWFGERRERGQVWQGTLTHDTRELRLNLSGGRSLAASGRGFLARRDELSAAVSHEFSRQFGASFSVRGVRQQDLLLGLSSERRDYFSAEVSLSRRVSPQWSLTVNAGAREASADRMDDSVQGWFGGFAARWTPAPWAASR